MLRFAVLGSPIGHSLSPVLHRAAFAARSITAEYQAHRVEHLAQWLEANSHFSGFSLTMPLKGQAFALAASHDGDALETGAVNTLIKTAGGYSGYNTDVEGIRFALREVEISNAVVIGTGATARSALVALRPSASSLMIYGRNAAASRALADEFGAIAIDGPTALRSATVISTLPAGGLLQFVDISNLRPSGTLLDVVYQPWPTEAARQWMHTGSAISGLEMLLGQAVLQQQLFVSSGFDREITIAAMRASLNVEE
jgi:shikimate dehydrogenase